MKKTFEHNFVNNKEIYSHVFDAINTLYLKYANSQLISDYNLNSTLKNSNMIVLSVIDRGLSSIVYQENIHQCSENHCRVGHRNWQSNLSHHLQKWAMQKKQVTIIFGKSFNPVKATCTNEFNICVSESLE